MNYVIRKKKIAIILTCVVSTAIVLCTTSCSSSTQVSSDLKTKSDNPYTVSPTKADLSKTISGIGVMQASRTTGASYKELSGAVKKIMVALGDKVEEDQPLMEIDVSEQKKKIQDMEQTMQRWPVKLQQVSENINNADRKIKSIEMELSIATNRAAVSDSTLVDTAQRQLKQAELDLERAKKMNSIETNYINQQALEKAQLAYDQAQSNYDSAQKQSLEQKADNEQTVEKLKLSYQQAQSEYKSALLEKQLSEMDYKTQQLELADLKDTVNHSILKAPIKGTVVSLEKLSEGELVNSGRVVVRIADPKTFVLQVTSGDADVMQNVKGAVLNIKDEKYEVEVYAPQPGDQLEQVGQDNKTKNKFYLSFVNKVPSLSMTDTYEVKLDITKKGVLTLPGSAFSEDNSKVTVNVLRNGRIESVEVVKGLQKDEISEVISGISEDDRVVLK